MELKSALSPPGKCIQLKSTLFTTQYIKLLLAEMQLFEYKE